MKINIKNFKTIKNEITLCFDRSNIISLVGENGAGKSNIMDGIHHFYLNGIEDEIITINSDVYYEDKENLKITFVIDCSEKEKKTINSFIEKYKIENMDSINMQKHFYKSVDTRHSHLLAIDTSFYYLLMKKVMIILQEYNSKYIDLNILDEIKFTDSNLNKGNFWNINKKINKIKALNVKDWQFLEELSKQIHYLKHIFLDINLIITYSKNADIDNNLHFAYDFLKYETDRNTKIAIDFFVENPLDIISKLKLSNDGTEKGAKLIDAEKQRIKKHCTAKMKNIFSTLNIYAEPRIDIDGSNLKVFVKTTKEYLINDNISTKNNSTGYKSILWILLTLERIISDSKDRQINYIFLLDEPDKNIHPLLQQQMINYIADKIKNTMVKVIFTTHSPFLLIEQSNNFVVDRDDEGSTIISKNGKSLSSIYPKILNTKLMESPIFKTAYKNNIIIYISDEKTEDDIIEIRQYILLRNNHAKFDIEFIDINDKSNIEAISSLKKFDDIILLELNQKYFMDNIMFDKILENNEIKNK